MTKLIAELFIADLQGIFVLLSRNNILVWIYSIKRLGQMVQL